MLLLASDMTMIRTSVVVLCYNSLKETTQPCLESIIKNTPSGGYELIVVDNASADGTATYLQNFVAKHAGVRIQLNNTNKGYAGGNNDGINLAQGKYIVLLNNDTLVPSGWLDRLLRLLDDYPDIGLVGPVTNSAGNEQRIELCGLNERNYEEISSGYISRQEGVWFTTEKLGFFCVAMRRTLVDEIGLLDEAFGIGMFEDDDYCIRAKQAGFALAVVEDCFVYHKGSVSFKKLTTSDHLEIFNRNRNYFFEKHGILWTYVDIALGIWVKMRVDLTAVEQNGERATIERITGRINDMTNALYQLRDVEMRDVEIGGKPFIEMQLAEKHRHLMEMSDWATGLKNDNDRLVNEIMTMSRSRCYRLFRFLQRRGI